MISKNLEHPIEKASILSKFSFWYLKDVIKHCDDKFKFSGRKTYKTIQNHETESIREKFVNLWKNERRRKLKPSLFKVSFQLYGLQILIAGFYYMICELLTRSYQPIFLSNLLKYFTDENPLSYQEAFIQAFGLSMCTLVPVLNYHHYSLYLSTQYLKIKAGVTSLIYEKILQTSKSKTIKTMNGKVCNLLSTGTDEIWGMIENNADVYKGPVETVVFSFFIYQSMGVHALIGVFLILCFMPFQTWFSKIMSQYEEKILKMTDQRLQFVSEVINGIQMIKMYSWEKAVSDMMDKYRTNEIKLIARSWFIYALLMVMKVVAKLSMFSSLAAYILAGNSLKSENVFMLSVYYYYLNISMVQYWPLALKAVYSGFVSLKRIEEFLLEESEAISALYWMKSVEKGAIEIVDATASWKNDDSTQTTAIKSVSVLINPGSFNLVVGQVASGKTSLLHLITKELELDEGKIEVSGEISYASQKSWLFSDTIRNNILFGEAFDEKRYREVIDACALSRDFESFIHGDQTNVAERGVSLSGGQKARINLARAVYRKADVYLFDDVLAAVDANVGNHIFFECFKKILKGKTIVLVTHQLQYTKEADLVCIMNNGYMETKKSLKEFKAENVEGLLSRNEKRTPSEKEMENQNEKNDEEDEESFQNKISLVGNMREYLEAVGSVKLTCFVSSLTMLSQVFNFGIDKFLINWTNWEESVTEDSDDISSLRFNYLATFSIFVVLLTIISYKAYVLMFSSLVKASQKLHNRMFSSIIKTSMKFFTKNSSGKIISRFSKDVGRLDGQAPNVIFCVFVFILEFMTIILLVINTNFFLLLPSLIFITTLFFTRRIFIPTLYKLQTAEETYNEDLLTHVRSTLNGLATIRALKGTKTIIQNFINLQNQRSSSLFTNVSFYRGFCFMADFSSAIFITLCIFSFLLFESDQTANDRGLTLTQVTSLIGVVVWGLTMISENEKQMISVGKIVEFCELPREDAKGSKEVKINDGKIEFRNFSMKYSSSGKTILNNLSFLIKPREKIGIVGRTGSGKTSIALSIFKIIEGFEGKILIDDEDIGEMKLESLRQHLTMILQDSILFTGSLRMNLDPMNQHSDQKLWQALDDVKMKEFIEKCPGKLNFNLSENGSNLSVGQRQLLSLARALLRPTKVLILDEVTSNIDNKTDQLIQQTIKVKFANCTIITIAHRLDTIIESDKVLVMEDGKVEEFGHPKHLIEVKNGKFRSLIENSRKFEHLQNKAIENFKKKT